MTDYGLLADDVKDSPLYDDEPPVHTLEAVAGGAIAGVAVALAACAYLARRLLRP